MKRLERPPHAWSSACAAGCMLGGAQRYTNGAIHAAPPLVTRAAYAHASTPASVGGAVANCPCFRSRRGMPHERPGEQGDPCSLKPSFTYGPTHQLYYQAVDDRPWSHCVQAVAAATRYCRLSFDGFRPLGDCNRVDFAEPDRVARGLGLGDFVQ